MIKVLFIWVRLAGIAIPFSLCLPQPAFAQGTAGVHPGFDLVNILPAGFQDGIGGMDFLPDGKLAVCTWGGIQKKLGKVFILSGVEGAGPGGVAFREVAATLNEPLGLRVVGQDIYIMQKHELTRLTGNSNGSYALTQAYAGFFHEPGQYHQFAAGLEHRAGSFYFMATSSHGIKLESGERGALLRLDPAAKTHEIIANGLREPNGVALGPDGEYFATDNQGEWKPSSMLVHLKKGRFFGLHGASAPVAAGRPVSPPAIWFPHGETSRSPSEPVLVRSGIFSGQMLVGDVALGGVRRLFLEKVKGEYQGAILRFSDAATFSAGWNRLIFGPDGALYLGGIGGNATLGNPGGWNWLDKTYGLQKLKPNGKAAFEMLAVRSQAEGFEIEFTKPIGQTAILAANFAVKKWWYTPTSAYGGPKAGETGVTVKAVRISVDRRKVSVDLDGFEILKVYHLKLNEVVSESGESLWGSEAWYTLLNKGVADVPTREVHSRAAPRRMPMPAAYRLSDGGFRVRLSREDRGREWRLMALDGSALASGMSGVGDILVLPRIGIPGIAWLLIRDESGAWSFRAMLLP